MKLGRICFIINRVFLVLITNSAADADIVVYVCQNDVSFLSVYIHQETEFECILGAAQMGISKQVFRVISYCFLGIDSSIMSDSPWSGFLSP